MPGTPYSEVRCIRFERYVRVNPRVNVIRWARRPRRGAGACKPLLEQRVTESLHSQVHSAHAASCHSPSGPPELRSVSLECTNSWRRCLHTDESNVQPERHTNHMQRKCRKALKWTCTHGWAGTKACAHSCGRLLLEEGFDAHDRSRDGQGFKTSMACAGHVTSFAQPHALVSVCAQCAHPLAPCLSIPLGVHSHPQPHRLPTSLTARKFCLPTHAHRVKNVMLAVTGWRMDHVQVVAHTSRRTVAAHTLSRQARFAPCAEGLRPGAPLAQTGRVMGMRNPPGSSHHPSRVFNVYICSARLPPCACSLACHLSLF